MALTLNVRLTRPARVNMGRAAVLLFLCGLGMGVAAAEKNLLQNPGFEESASSSDTPPHWTTAVDSAGKAALSDKEAHAGRQTLVLPANTAVEQKLGAAPAGAYLARCWVKSETAQPVAFLLQDPDRPWAAYTCAENKVPPGQWVQLEAFLALDRAGSLKLTLGGMSQQFRFYHGVGGEMTAPILADDFELVRYEPKLSDGLVPLAIWDGPRELGESFDWTARSQWSSVQGSTHTFTGTPIFEGRHLAGAVRHSDGALAVYGLEGGQLKPRCLITPSTALPAPKCSLVQGNDQTGIRVSSETGDRSYTAWFTAKGLIRIEPDHIPRFAAQHCRLRYALLPSFAGTDICYAAAKMTGDNEFHIPSTHWLVGLVDGSDSMLVAAWEKNSQAVSLGVSGAAPTRLIDSLSIATDQSGFCFSLVEHPGLWRQETLKEDWLGDYTAIDWQRPFPARWMGQFFVSPGGRPSFREPYLDYSFPVACAKTRMWGVWFEDWNHYPFFFDGPRTIVHFEKSFIPQGDALLYFLEPAAADLYSPCEIVEQALGAERAAALLDFDANQLRRLNYSTPDEFMYDRPVCATTTRLSKIKQAEKPTIGVNLATHLYEFIREIRGRVDQYRGFFEQMNNYLAEQQKGQPELQDYVAELEGMLSQAQARSKEIYATSLPSVQEKIDAMKQRLQNGQGDGFDCGNLDVRGTAGSQDDLCRQYNRLVMRLAQVAAMKCGDSPQKAAIATHIWEQSRAVLRRPTRWESRRTLYFFEP